MLRLFLRSDQFSEEGAVVDGADHIHLTRVLRSKPGDHAVLLDNAGSAFLGTIVAIGKGSTQLRIDGPTHAIPEPSVCLIVAQALGKSDKFEQVVQHGVEIGASAFLPVRSERCVADIPKEASRAAEKLSRWNQIARSAAEQSGRSRIPEVLSPVTSASLFSGELKTTRVDADTLRLLLHPGENVNPLRSILKSLNSRPTSVLVAVGPEGGWSKREVRLASEAGWHTVLLGRYVMRTETAALAALSNLMLFFED